MTRGSGPGSTATGRHTASSLRTDTAMVLVSGIGGTPVHAELQYRCDDPFAVQMRLSFPAASGHRCRGHRRRGPWRR